MPAFRYADQERRNIQRAQEEAIRLARVSASTVDRQLSSRVSLVETANTSLSSRVTETETDIAVLDAAVNSMQDTLGSITPALKYVQTFGTASDLTYAITHNLGTEDIVVSVKALTVEPVGPQIEVTNANTVTLTFDNPPGLNSYRIIIIG